MLERDIIEVSQQWLQFNQCIPQKFVSYNLEMFDNKNLQSYEESGTAINRFMFVSIHDSKVKGLCTRLKFQEFVCCYLRRVRESTKL